MRLRKYRSTENSLVDMFHSLIKAGYIENKLPADFKPVAYGEERPKL
jgi:hypothetical protein